MQNSDEETQSNEVNGRSDSRDKNIRRHERVAEDAQEIQSANDDRSLEMLVGSSLTSQRGKQAKKSGHSQERQPEMDHAESSGEREEVGRGFNTSRGRREWHQHHANQKEGVDDSAEGHLV